MLLGEGSAHGGHGVVKARLVHGDDVDVALHQDEVGPPGLLGVVDAVEDAALFEDGGLRGVHVLGLGAVHHPAGEADHIPPGVDHRQHEPVVELVVDAAVFPRRGQPGLQQLRLVEALLRHGPGEGVPAVRGGPQAEAGGEFWADAPLLPDVPGHRLPLRAGELLPVKAGGLPVQLQDAPAPRLPVLVPPGLVGDGHPLLTGQLLHRLGKGDPLHLHEEAKGPAPLAAAEAVEDLLVLVDGKGGGLLVVEGAQPPVVGPLLGEGDIGGHHVHDIDPAAELLQEPVGYGHGVHLPDDSQNLWVLVDGGTRRPSASQVSA